MKLFKISIIAFFCLLTLHSCYAGARVIKTHLGEIRGQKTFSSGKIIDQYLGIPFAKFLTSEFRFKKAQPIEKYDKVIEAFELAPNCPHNLCITKNKTMDENCLFLNIWNPNDESTNGVLKPVMFYVNEIGNEQDEYLNLLSSFGDVIVVSSNYRSSSFGFLTTGHEEEPGNLALYDHNLALRWVQQNIGYFGGDPSQVTIFGSGEGSSFISYHIISGISEGLFKRAILQSGFYYFRRMANDKQSEIDLSLKLARLVGCAPSAIHFGLYRKEIIRCLRDKTIKDILEAENKLLIDDFSLHIDGELIRSDDIFYFPNHFDKDVEIMMGVTKEEGYLELEALINSKSILDLDSLKKTSTMELITSVLTNDFIDPQKLITPYFKNVDEHDQEGIKTAIVNLYSDYYYICPSLILADAYSNEGGRVHYYIYNYHTKSPYVPNMGSSTYMHQLLFTLGIIHNHPKFFSKKEVNFSKHLMMLWTDFAKGKDLQEHGWPLYDPHSNLAMELHPDRNSTIPIPRAELCDKLWKTVSEMKFTSFAEQEGLPKDEF